MHTKPHHSLVVRLNAVVLALLFLGFAALFVMLTRGLDARLLGSTRQHLSASNSAVVDLLGAYRSNLDRAARGQQAVWRSFFAAD
uniref:hypothetical protein n=1 Tax=Chitinimonas sp. TaxID=1934313 RepID=UPI0035AF8567